jgi:hypothetical protein
MVAGLLRPAEGLLAEECAAFCGAVRSLIETWPPGDRGHEQCIELIDFSL